ncbi:LPS assembly lipoprotein LptE [Sphingobium sp.]|uniref:LPS assembly lipoprotein LptE n=1 Tax=Sphingobium sp. TaxID=1912891 RepID=UPI0039C9D695
MALMLSGLLSGCGLHPLYEGGLHSAGAKGLAGVEVAPIPGKAGWLVRNALNERLAPMSGGTPRYKLTVSLDDKIDGLGVRSDNTVTRERRTLRARFQLHDNNQPADAPALVDEVVGSDAGLDVTSSEYATVAAEDTALERLSEVIADRIVARIAIDAEHRAGK